MKSLFCVIFVLSGTVSCFAQLSKQNNTIADSSKKIIPVEVSCGQCQFHLKGKGCDLAIRINNKAYFADNISIDAFGDAHAKDGFCNAIRQAEVQGKLKNNRFVVSYIKILPEPK